MWYTRRHETTHFYPTFKRGRTAPDPGRIAFLRCLCVTSLPDSAGFGSWGTRPQHRSPVGLRRPDGTQCDPWLQCDRTEGLARRLLTPPSLTNGLCEEKTDQLKDLLHRSPREFGKEQGTWTLQLVA